MVNASLLDRAAALIRRSHTAQRRRLAADAAESALRLETAYQREIGKIDKLLLELRVLAADPGTKTVQLNQTRTLLRLRDEFEVALKALANQIRAEAGRMTISGLRAGRHLAGVSLLAAGITNGVDIPAMSLLQSVINYVDSVAFQARLAEFPTAHAEHITDIILINGSRGVNPRLTAGQITRYVEGYPLADALTMTRTVQLWSARRSQIESYKANADIVAGWIWSADLGGARTCESCTMMHGTFHTLDEILDDHYNGRCSPVPVTKSWAEMGFADRDEITAGIPKGTDWFREQDESTQKHILGPGKYAAWRDGVFQLEQIPTHRADPVYGQMRGAATLRELTAQAA